MSIEWKQVLAVVALGAALASVPRLSPMTLDEMVKSHLGGTYNNAQQSHVVPSIREYIYG